MSLNICEFIPRCCPHRHKCICIVEQAEQSKRQVQPDLRVYILRAEKAYTTVTVNRDILPAYP